jgi:hypothetical protein
MPLSRCLSLRGPPEHPRSGESDDPAPPFPPHRGARRRTGCEARNGRECHWRPCHRRREMTTQMGAGPSARSSTSPPCTRTMPAAALDGRACGTRSNTCSPTESSHRIGMDQGKAIAPSPSSHRGRNGCVEESVDWG